MYVAPVSIKLYDTAAVILTTSVFSLNFPTWMLSNAIHFNGSLTVSFESWLCLKYSVVYILSAKPKSATFITPSDDILHMQQSTLSMIIIIPNDIALRNKHKTCSLDHAQCSLLGTSNSGNKTCNVTCNITCIKLYYSFNNQQLIIASHAVSCCQIPMDKLLFCQVIHAFGYLQAH